MASSRWTSGRTALALVLLSSMGPWWGLPAEAQTPRGAVATPGWLPLESALRQTVQTGRPSVVVVTERSSPRSLELVKSLQQAAASSLVGRMVSFAEMSREAYPQQVDRMGVTTFPALLVYGQNGSRLKLLGLRSGPLDVPTTLAWLVSLPIGSMAAVRPPDPAVTRAAAGDDYPSAQAPYPSGQHYPPAPPKVPSQPQPQPQPIPIVPVPQAQVPPVYTAPAPQPVVVATPAQPVVVQPSQPQVIIGPSQPPQITFANAPTAAPSVSYVQPANAPTGNAPQQIFMANAPQPQPTGNAPPAQPMMYAMAPPMQPAMAPVGNAPPQVGQSPVMAAALLTNPRLWERLVGALGEHLAQKKNPRIQMGNAPTVGQAPVAMAPTGGAPTGYAPMGYAPTGYAPLAYAPVAQPAMMALPAMMPMYGPPPGYAPPYGYPPQQPYCPPPQPPGPPPNAPTPQYGGSSGPPPGYPPPYPPQPPAPQQQGSMLHRLLHH